MLVSMPTIEEAGLGWPLGVLFRAWRESVAVVLDEVPHGARGFQILATVAHDGPPTQAALAGHLGIDRTVLTYVLDDLVEAGLLERTTDAADRRVRRLVVTPAGAARLADLEARVGAAERSLLTGLTDEERESLQGSLDRAAAQIHSNDPAHDECSIVANILNTEVAARQS